MGAFAAIILFSVYIMYVNHLKNNAINHYDLNKVDTLKLTKDMDKPLHVREQNLLAGKNVLRNLLCHRY